MIATLSAAAAVGADRAFVDDLRGLEDDQATGAGAATAAVESAAATGAAAGRHPGARAGEPVRAVCGQQERAAGRAAGAAALGLRAIAACLPTAAAAQDARSRGQRRWGATPRVYAIALTARAAGAVEGRPRGAAAPLGAGDGALREARALAGQRAGTELLRVPPCEREPTLRVPLMMMSPRDTSARGREPSARRVAPAARVIDGA